MKGVLTVELAISILMIVSFMFTVYFLADYTFKKISQTQKCFFMRIYAEKLRHDLIDFYPLNGYAFYTNIKPYFQVYSNGTYILIPDCNLRYYLGFPVKPFVLNKEEYNVSLLLE